MLKRILPVLFAMCLMLSVGTLTAFADGNEAKIGTTEYATLEEALAVAAETTTKDTITLLKDVETDEVIKIDANNTVTIDGAGYTVTGYAEKTFEVYTNTITKNVTIVNTHVNGCCVDTRKAVYLKLQTGTKLIAENGNSQPLTIGGSTNGADVTLTGTTISAGNSGYGIIAFVETKLTIDSKSNISGYSAIYMKQGSTGSFVNIKGQSVLTGNNSFNEGSNDFGTIVYEDGGIDTQIHSSAKIIANGNGTATQSLFMFNAGSAENLNTIDFYNKGKAVTLEANGNAVFTCGTNLESAVVETNTAATKTAFENAGYVVDETSNIVEIIPTAIVDEVKYASWEDAVKVATKKNTAVEVIADVELSNDAEVTEVVVSNDVTLDLNGNNLTAKVTANGNIIDSTDGNGRVVGNITVNNHANKSYIPLPEEGAYRLFEISVKNQGIQLINDNARFLFTIMFNNKEAYKLLSLDSEADILCVEFEVTGAQAEEGTIVIGAATVKNFADAAYEQLSSEGKEETSKAISFTVKVSSYDTGDTISATPLIKTANGVVIGGFDTMTYTKE